ncbi:MAG: sigma-54 dependent transcriptional regulator [Myxococcales bacterium]|nr:sigma-54 dependent transcriptional regulator [Myxococcota bacterium]MDW8281991.1 sigma-54 dependent transcriptional regulator [Myxococcales bacterium]
MADILIIDDNLSMREGMAAVIRRMGHEVRTYGSGKEALAAMAKKAADFVITDLRMEGMDGVEVLRRVRELDPDCPVLIVTAYGTVEAAVEAMKLGAMDFITKPFAPEEVRLKVERALELRAVRRAVERLSAENEHLRSIDQGRYGEMVGSTEAMRRVFATIERVARSDTAVAIYGESGTGKELVARAIHMRSPRAGGPFIKVNCGALAESLLESELFGHEKGAFTGAIKRRLGRIELADGGTLFLDEIGEISPAMQVKLLRVLQEREFERVGGEQTIRVNIRLISATHRDLMKLIEKGLFREDLFYRIQVVPITVPPLRERKADIPDLVAHFIRRLAPRVNPQVSGIEEDALMRLLGYSWPGNVRELENVIEQALVFTEGNKITVSALPPVFRGAASEGALTVPPGPLSLPEILDDLERQLILKAYEQAKGVKTETARLLGIKTSALYYKLEKYGIG